MNYALFDLLAVALPAALLLRGVPGRRVLVAPGAALSTLALLWTTPWDDHLVRTGVWSYDPAQVIGRIGSIPVEEYAFVVLEVVFVGAWALRSGAVPLAPAAPADIGCRRRGALAWVAVAATGLLLLLVGGQLRYLGLLLVWVGPPLALQQLVAGDVLTARRRIRLRIVLPTALWLCAADRLALAAGVWTISPGSSTGLALVGLPIEEALFFVLTCLLVTDGLLLAADPVVLRRVMPTPARSCLGAQIVGVLPQPPL